MSSIAVRTKEPAGSAVNYRSLSDIELIRACQKGSEQAFRELVNRYEGKVLSILSRYASDWPDKADLAQEVFIRIWRGIDKLQNPSSFKSWLNQIVVNLFYDELRRRSKQNSMLSLDQVWQRSDGPDWSIKEIEDDAPGPEELYERKHLNQAMIIILSGLPPQFQKAIVLRELEGLSYAEIAEVMQSDIGTVKSRIFRAKTRLQLVLKEHDTGMTLVA